MDIERPSNVRERKIRRAAYLAIVLVAAGGLAYSVSHLRPAAPFVDKSSIWTDEVKRGDLVRVVRGSGSLVPEETRWIPSQTDGRVDRILVQPGATVSPNTILLELTNPQLQGDVETAEYELKGAEADYEDLKAQLNGDLLKQKAVAQTTRSQYEQAKLQNNVDEQFRQEGLGSDLKAKLSKGNMEQLAIQLQSQEDSVKSAADSARARLSAAQSKVDQQRSMCQFKLAKLDALHVRAGIEGVLQQVSVEVGQQVGSGVNLARVANPKKLEARVAVAQTEVKDVHIGQTVSLDTGNGLLAGRVVHIAPAVVDNSVMVDVDLPDALPTDTRPDLSVNASIEIAQLRNVLYVGRPVHGQENGTLALFRMVHDGASALRRSVKLGSSSADKIEVVAGLNEGDTVILSDMSDWDRFDRIQLK